MADLLPFPPATTATPQPPDWRERQRALDTRASWIVEAPAGSGKTGLLIQRYLRLFADPGVDQPEQILAITFTRKATGELRDRVLRQLESATRNDPPGNEFDRQTRPLAEAVLARDRASAWGLLDHPRRMNISTIDAVSAEIARALPLLSGSGGRQSPVPDATHLYQEAARRTLLQLGGPDTALDHALRTVLLHRDANLIDCERLIAQMLQVREQWGELVPLAGHHLEDAYLETEVLPRLERALETTVCRALTQLSRTIPRDLLRELTLAAAEYGRLDGYRDAVSPIALFAGCDEPPGERAEDLAHWRALIHLLVAPSTRTWRKSFNVNHLGFAAQKHHKDHLARLILRLHDRDDLLHAMCRLGKLPPTRYPQEQWLVAKALFRVLSRALAELQIVFAEAGECDFSEIALAARAALDHDNGVDDLAAAVGFRTRHLLIDEMQDTSTSQYRLIERLTQGWDGVSQTVFLVGDPKQSIYRFRQARVERFVRTMHDLALGDLPLGCLRLTANFRSQGRLVAQFNEDFAKLFPPLLNIAHPEDVPFAAASAMLPAGSSPGSRWHARVVPYSDDPEARTRSRQRITQQNARATREIAIEWLSRDTPATVAVLVRSRSHLAGIAAELKRDDGEGAVPYRAVEIEPLGERQEILDLTALTRALLHPADRVAWLAVLHAPWCGLGLADLHMLTGAGDPKLKERTIPDLLRDRGHLLSPTAEDRLARVWPVLEEANRQRGRLPLAQWVERTWHSLGGSAYLDREKIANTQEFFSLLDELEATGERVDLATLSQRLTKLYARPAVHPFAVDLMTIHGAKGLEWDVVIVPALDRPGQMDRSRLLEWAELDGDSEDAAQVVLAPIAGRGEASQDLNSWIREIHKTREAAERKRLLYVASTRAKQELHLFATPDESKDAAIKPVWNSLLASAWPIAEPFFTGSGGLEAEENPRLAISGDFVGDLAAQAANPIPISRPPTLQRLPAGYDPAARFTSLNLPVPPPAPEPPRTAFVRPEGSFAARSFGNAMHALLDAAAQKIAAESTPLEAMLAAIRTWQPRAASLLRADGLAPAMVTRLAPRIVDALLSTLNDPDGQWILGAHPDAPLTAAQSEVALADIRIDRLFHAGPTPRAPGAGYLWIVDYKTGTHAPGGLEEFLARERARYQPQLEAYARTLSLTPSASPAGVRLALYYPSLARLLWWIPETA
jgi:ATP-dependent helicase/nuclease subunit A